MYVKLILDTIDMETFHSSL